MGYRPTAVYYVEFEDIMKKNKMYNSRWYNFVLQRSLGPMCLFHQRARVFPEYFL